MMFQRLMIALATAGLLTACGGGSQSAAEDQTVTEQSAQTQGETTAEAEPAEAPESAGKMGKMGGMMDKCPMHVEGTSMTLEDTENGVAMAFANEANAAEVQERARKMAEHHPMAMEHHGSELPPFNVVAEDTETGARLMMTPEDPSQMEAFKAAIHQRHEAQGDKKCPMMMMYKK